MNSHEVFIHIHQGCFAGTGAIVRLPQCQWSKPDGYGKISQCITTTKHSKAKTVCIFLGIYCKMPVRYAWQSVSVSPFFGTTLHSDKHLSTVLWTLKLICQIKKKNHNARCGICVSHTNPQMLADLNMGPVTMILFYNKWIWDSMKFILWGSCKTLYFLESLKFWL